jgi:hypothetical protein
VGLTFSSLAAMPILAAKEFGVHQLGAALGVLFISFGPGELFGVCESIRYSFGLN